MPETNKVVLEKLGEIGDRIQHVQEKSDSLAEKYDALDFASVKENADLAAKGLEEVQQLKQDIAAFDFKERMDAIELAIARSGGHDRTDPDQEKAYKKAMLGYLRKGRMIPDEVLEIMCKSQVDMELLGIGEDDRIEFLKKDLVAASGPDGGYFIIPDRASSISVRIFESSPIRPVANIVTTMSDVWEIPLDDDEFSSGWVGEVEARPDTLTSEIGLIKIPVHEGYAQPRATQKMLDDAGFDIESWINQKVSSKLGRQENTAFVAGDGSKKPKGFLDYPAWAAAGVYERHKVEQYVSTGTAGTVDEADDFITLSNMLLEEFQAGAAWGMRRATFTDVMTLKDTQGRYLIDPQIIKTSTDKVLVGSPVIFMSDMPAVAANALSVVFADWSEFYTIVDRLGIRILRDPYTATPYVRFYTTKRVGGAVTNYQAGKIMKVKA